MYIKRDIEIGFEKYLKAPEIIAIIGPRQSGKTTFVKHILEKKKNITIVSFDGQTDRKLFEESPDDFATKNIKKNGILFIDEFHYAKDGGKILKYIFDTYDKPKIIISGSSGIDITVKAIKYLVGRILIFNLYPFNFQEFLRVKDKGALNLYSKYRQKFSFKKSQGLSLAETETHKLLMKYFEEYLLFGGYPRVVLEKNIESKEKILQDIYSTYFLREVKDILGLIDDYKLSSLIKALSLQIGNLIEYNDLSRISGFSFSTLKKYLNFLEKTYICRFVRPFYKNKRIEIVKNPKVYFVDTGIRNIIINDFKKLKERTDKGSLLENGIVSQFIKQDVDFNFWRDKNKNEIDFVLNLKNRKTVAIESKTYLKETKLPGLSVFKELYPEIDFYWSFAETNEKVEKKGRVYPCYLY